MEAIQVLNRKLKKAKGHDRPAILQGIYKQLATSRKGKKAKGEFRTFVENDSYHGHDFVWHVANQLDKHGLANHASRLRDQYSGVPREPQRSWTELPNLVGDKDTVEELCSSGDVGRDFAAFGAIASALNRSAKARAQPGEPRFLYPTSRQFPFDEVSGKLVKALEERSFDVPGIKVKLDSYGPSDSYSYVGKIEGDDFRLWFCGKQGSLGEFNDIAAVTKLNMPLKELHVYDDNSGPTFYLYVGDNWEADKHDFVHGSKVNSKLNGKPRTYLQYGGSWQKTSKGGVFYPGKVAPFLAHDNDLGREYEPANGDPRYFETQAVFNEFKEFLEGKLEQITSK